jgi:N-acetylmuramoyl-L-alanine amidase
VRFLLPAFLALAPLQPVTVTLRHAGQSRPIAAAENGSLLSVPEFVAGIGGSTRPQPGGSLVSEVAGHRIVAADGVATVAFDDRVVALAHPVRAFEGVLFAPWEFFEKTVLPASGFTAAYDRAGRTVTTRTGTAAAASIEVSLIHLNNMTQVVFRQSGPVAFTTSAGDGSFRVAFQDPVMAPFPQKNFGDPYVTRIEFSGGEAVVELRETGLSVNPYTLKNPDRLVLEIVPREAAPGPAQTVPPALPVPTPATRTVVIDPGHGGEETGAIGPGNVFEKDVTLDISRRLAAVIAAAGLRPVLTRSSDTVVALDERAAIANHEKAAVFLSIHGNSSRAAGASGSETYYLSLAASDKLSDAVAQQENSSPGTPAPSTSGDLDFILWDMAQSAHLRESAALAESIQNELNTLLHTENRGIKQAPFRVLVGATMPAVLVETAFLSNPEEARKLAKPEFRQSVAEAIGRAVAAFVKLHPGEPAPAP